MEIVDSNATPRCVHLESGCWRALFKEGALCAKAHNTCLRLWAFQRTRAGWCFSGGYVAAGAIGFMALLSVKAGMDEAARDKFWTWRRIVLTIGYCLVFLAGVVNLLEAHSNGLVLMLASAAGFVFLHRTWVGIVVWTYVAAAGAVALASGDDLGLFGLAAGLAFGSLALPWRKRSAAPAPLPQCAQPLPFMPAPADLAAVETAVATDLAPPPPPDPVVIERSVLVTPSELVSPIAGNGHLGPDPIYPGALFIGSIGHISLTLPWKDLTPDLMRRPVIGFLWLYLFAREMRKAGDRITRTALIDEVAHSVADPRGRLRGYLRDLAHLPAPLGSMIRVEEELIGFDLTKQETDLDELRASVEHVKQAGLKVAEFEIEHAQELLPDLGDGQFLPGFEEMEKRVTNGRGIAGQVVAEVTAHVAKGSPESWGPSRPKSLLRASTPRSAAATSPVASSSI